MEANLALGFGGDEQLDAEGDERDLDVTGPVGTSQRDTSLRLYPMIEIQRGAVKMQVLRLAGDLRRGTPAGK
jgi:hypothetical protein